MATETERETQTWWRASPGGAGRIEPFEVVSETSKTVTYVHPNVARPIRTNKVTSWDCWFPSEAQAVEWQRQRLSAALSSATRILEAARAHFVAFNEAHPLPATEERNDALD